MDQKLLAIWLILKRWETQQLQKKYAERFESVDYKIEWFFYYSECFKMLLKLMKIPLCDTFLSIQNDGERFNDFKNFRFKINTILR